MALYDKITLTVAIIGFVIIGIGSLYLNGNEKSKAGIIFATTGIVILIALIILMGFNMIWRWW